VSRPKGSRDSDHEAKRQDLLSRMTIHMVSRDGGRASLRELAAAAEVSVPTLRHYFGDRGQVIDAVLAEALRRGRPGLEAQRAGDRPFEMSIRDYARDLVIALTAPKTVRLGDLFAVSLAEGFLDPRLGPSALTHIVDPTVAALEARLAVHVAREEMIETDLRAASLVLISPLLLGCLHQHQLGGDTASPLGLEALLDDVVAAFVRAYQAPAKARKNS